MNKLKLIFALFFLIGNFVNAQVCTPDENITDLLVPSSNDDLAVAKVGVVYEQTFYFKIPADTTISNSFEAEINYLNILSIDSLPDGFTYGCSTVDCKFLGNTFGCMVINGTPDETFSGDSIRIILNANINWTGVSPPFNGTNGDFPVTENFAIYVEPADTLNSTSEINQNKLFTVFPNPTNNIINLEIETEEVGELQITINNISGQVVYNETILNYNGTYTNKLTKDELGLGIFFVQVTINLKKETVKLIIN